MKRTFLAFAALALLTTSAGAVDFNAKITQLDGKPLTDSSGQEQPTTLGMISEMALLATTAEDQRATTEVKVKRFALANKIRSGATELTSDETTLLKEVIGRSYSPLIVGRAFQILDPASVPK